MIALIGIIGTVVLISWVLTIIRNEYNYQQRTKEKELFEHDSLRMQLDAERNPYNYQLKVKEHHNILVSWVFGKNAYQYIFKFLPQKLIKQLETKIKEFEKTALGDTYFWYLQKITDQDIHYGLHSFEVNNALSQLKKIRLVYNGEEYIIHQSLSGNIWFSNVKYLRDFSCENDGIRYEDLAKK